MVLRTAILNVGLELKVLRNDSRRNLVDDGDDGSKRVCLYIHQRAMVVVIQLQYAVTARCKGLRSLPP